MQCECNIIWYPLYIKLVTLCIIILLEVDKNPSYHALMILYTYNGYVTTLHINSIMIHDMVEVYLHQWKTGLLWQGHKVYASFFSYFKCSVLHLDEYSFIVHLVIGSIHVKREQRGSVQR